MGRKLPHHKVNEAITSIFFLKKSKKTAIDFIYDDKIPIYK